MGKLGAGEDHLKRCFTVLLIGSCQNANVDLVLEYSTRKSYGLMLQNNQLDIGEKMTSGILPTT